LSAWNGKILDSGQFKLIIEIKTKTCTMQANEAQAVMRTTRTALNQGQIADLTTSWFLDNSS